MATPDHKKVRGEVFQAQQDELARIGRRYPPELIADLAENLFETIRKWLLANLAPDSIIEGIDDIVMLGRYESFYRPAKMGEGDFAGLPEMIANDTQIILELGGDFNGDGGHEPLKWHPDPKKIEDLEPHISSN